jgi:hypothetical protein
MQTLIQQATKFATSYATLIARCDAGHADAISKYAQVRDVTVSKITGIAVSNDCDDFDNACSDFDYYVEQATQ